MVTVMPWTTPGVGELGHPVVAVDAGRRRCRGPPPTVAAAVTTRWRRPSATMVTVFGVRTVSW